MELRLHANATTTPKTRAYIQRSKAPVAVLAAELGVGEKTIRRWRSRKSVADRSHTPKRLAISLSAAEERLVLELRTALALPLDDIVEVMRRCVNAKLSRSAIHRCLRRHGVSARPKDAKPQVGNSRRPASVSSTSTSSTSRASMATPASCRRHRSRHPLRAYRGHHPTRRRYGCRLPCPLPRRLPTQGANHPDRQRLGVTDRFGGAYWSTRADGTSCLRSCLRQAWHRPSPHQALPTADQRRR